MITIRERSASGGVRYEVLVRVPGQPTVKRMFRRLSEAKMWAHQQAQHLQPGGRGNQQE
jgi:hypothetical protein